MTGSRSRTETRTGTRPRPRTRPGTTANLCTKILDFRGFDSSIILILRGGILMSREFPGMFESTNLRRGNLSREIGRRTRPRPRPRTRPRPEPGAGPGAGPGAWGWGLRLGSVLGLVTRPGDPS